MSTYEALKYTFTGANLTSIPTSAITSGTFADARISSGSVTQHVSAVTNTSGTWTPTFYTASANFGASVNSFKNFSDFTLPLSSATLYQTLKAILSLVSFVLSPSKNV